MHVHRAHKYHKTATVRLDLHHVLSGLAGPDGRPFDAAAGNPCTDMGNGTLNDLQAQEKVRRLLAKAEGEAMRGVATKRLATARADAQCVERNLMRAKAAYRWSQCPVAGRCVGRRPVLWARLS